MIPPVHNHELGSSSHRHLCPSRPNRPSEHADQANGRTPRTVQGTLPPVGLGLQWKAVRFAQDVELVLLSPVCVPRVRWTRDDTRRLVECR